MDPTITGPALSGPSTDKSFWKQITGLKLEKSFWVIVQPENNSWWEGPSQSFIVKAHGWSFHPLGDCDAVSAVQNNKAAGADGIPAETLKARGANIL